jgi:bifunctional non-homologous end joining protein LigD
MGLNQGRDEKLCLARTELVAQIEFTEWTPDGHLRHSKFIGLREDKEAGEVIREH